MLGEIGTVMNKISQGAVLTGAAAIADGGIGMTWAARSAPARKGLAAWGEAIRSARPMPWRAPSRWQSGTLRLKVRHVAHLVPRRGGGPLGHSDDLADCPSDPAIGSCPGGERGRRLLTLERGLHAFLARPIEGEWPYLWLDATYVKVRRDHHIVSVAVIVAVGVNTDGRREVLGMTTGDSEAEPFWSEFLRRLRHRGFARRQAGRLRRPRRSQGGYHKGSERDLAALPLPGRECRNWQR